MNKRETARHIFLEAVRGVLPGRITSELVTLRGNLLKIGYLNYDLERTGDIWIIGAGKASAAMAHYVENILGERISGGHIITKYGHLCMLRKVKVTEAGHPVPDENSFSATRDIIRIADNAAENDLVICLWSGGGSSLLADYPENSSPEDIGYLNGMLVKSGADIREINTVRKHLSGVKGGFLARHIHPASYVNILLSDVPGDHADIIASGPAVPDSSTFSDALNVLEKYQMKSHISEALLNYLYEGLNGNRPETPKPGDPVFAGSASILAGNNRTALLAAAKEAGKLGYTTFIVNDNLTGDTEDVCNQVIESINKYMNDNTLTRPICLLSGGETTVTVTGDKPGGRNQHLALLLARRLAGIPGVTFLSAGTDGNDGNTDMAGAVVDSGTLADADAMIMAETYLKEFDAYSFFRSAGGHIHTGPTLTNVMDIVVVLIS